jgi:AcrR family transcriptional regulator
MIKDTKQQIAAAALEALRTLGFAGATSRALARIGGFNQALVFYHYGSLENALLAGLDLTSAERLARYRTAVAGIDSLDQLTEVLRPLYREDVESGHVGVVAQMVAGSVARPDLAREVLSRIEPWVELAADALRRVAPVPLPVEDVAYALVSFYLGANLLTHLDDGARMDALFAHAQSLVHDRPR